MKQKWENPSLLQMNVEKTNEECNTFDLGHNWDDVNHTHKCKTCNKYFQTWNEAMLHESESPNCFIGSVPMS